MSNAVKAEDGAVFGMSSTLLYKSRLGIEKGSLTSLVKFLDAHRTLVYALVQEYYMPPLDLKELVRAAHVGLLHALEQVTAPCASVRFYTVVGGDIREAIRSFIETTHRVERVSYLYLGHYTTLAGGTEVLLVRDSLFHQCNLVIGDEILTINHQEVHSVGDVNAMLQGVSSGEAFSLSYLHAGELLHDSMRCE